ncbi:MAG: hypothetical protein H6722_17310 [Sandaracinus sp.]|nr:hypothetical protein [Sandaracinus sp.]MCB9614199.1 hypothetical protein [Sandaracinus sp.]MCB9620108.1 hypothetical protein [Sandaracinus sp.]MCB9622520.1 hypothetical protein [Sandaracinus sp.]
MCSQTFLGRDVFMSYWGLTALGYLAAHRPSVFPRGLDVRPFVDARGEHHQRFLELVETEMGLDAGLVAVAWNEAPWVEGPERSTLDDVSLWAGRMLSDDDLVNGCLDEVLDVGARRCMGCLMDAWIGAHFCFGDRTQQPDRVLEALDALVQIVGPSTIPGRNVMLGWRRWIDEQLPRLMGGDGIPEYVAWLRAASCFG